MQLAGQLAADAARQIPPYTSGMIWIAETIPANDAQGIQPLLASLDRLKGSL